MTTETDGLPTEAGWYEMTSRRGMTCRARIVRTANDMLLIRFLDGKESYLDDAWLWFAFTRIPAPDEPANPATEGEPVDFPATCPKSISDASNITFLQAQAKHYPANQEGCPPDKSSAPPLIASATHTDSAESAVDVEGIAEALFVAFESYGGNKSLSEAYWSLGGPDAHVKQVWRHVAETVVAQRVADAERERDTARALFEKCNPVHLCLACSRPIGPGMYYCGCHTEADALRVRVAELEKKLVGIVPSLLSPAQAANPNPSIADLRKGADIVARLKEPKTI